eukprot:TRINITY_DN66583_c14_g8_i1.p1 TRINITY_DN66583_c14_g8~~TRINITY_DN66583_c14_g8_i1.p1  ORF type:complete len:997 (-),score=462.54 TRINITY_DN66583_c14_g8_i1:1473-4430(-)
MMTIKALVVAVAVTTLMAASSTLALPDQCVGLAKVHGQNNLNNWMMTTQQDHDDWTSKVMCEHAQDCKRLLRPLMTADMKNYVRKCPNDCSGNGICQAGNCTCEAGYEGADCSVMRCKDNCHGNGKCKLGKCWCFPGFGGSTCDKKVQCPKYAGLECAGHGTCSLGKCFCNPGFTGELCSEVARCPRDCSNRGFCLHGQCFCPKGWGGKACDVRNGPASCPNHCSGHGQCDQGKCMCDAGFYGADCAKEVSCPVGANGEACSGRGTCRNGICECDEGRLGHTCALVQSCPGNGTCSGHGLCHKGSCYCHSGFSGEDCSKKTPCANGCSGQGVCVDSKCHCMPGYHGVDCSQGHGPAFRPESTSKNNHAKGGAASCPFVPPVKCVNGTKPAPVTVVTPPLDGTLIRKLLREGKECPGSCSGMGVCLNGTCACLPGRAGEDCGVATEPVKCPKDCSYRGVCFLGKCMCMPPYKGADCGMSDDPSAHASSITHVSKCSGHGTFKRGRCVCDPGYAGYDCSMGIPCKDNCGGRGTCHRGKCFCYPGFEGAACERAARCPSGCSGHGECFYGKCFCHNFYHGEDCSETPSCSKGCENGVCMGIDQCVCKPGWTGVSCSEKLSCPNDCTSEKNGYCALTERGVRCICRRQFMGDDCSQPVDKCPKDCHHRGVCVMGTCKCESGFSGIDCGTKIGGANLNSLVANNVGAEVDPDNNKPGQPKQPSGPKKCHRTADAGATGSLDQTGAQLGFCDEDEDEKVTLSEKNAAGNTAAALKGGLSAKPPTPADTPTPATGMPSQLLSAIPSNAGGVPTHNAAKDAPRFREVAAANADMAAEVEVGATTSAMATTTATATATASSCPKNCTRHGVCSQGKCFCDPGFTGVDCSTVVYCPDDCSGNGICKYGQCYCDPHYHGDNCSKKTLEDRVFPQTWLTSVLVVLALLIGLVGGTWYGRHSMTASGKGILSTWAPEHPPRFNVAIADDDEDDDNYMS